MSSLAYRSLTIICCSSVGFWCINSPNSWAMQLNNTPPTNPSTLLNASFVYSVKSPTATPLKLTATSENVVFESPLKFQSLPTHSKYSFIDYKVTEEFAKSGSEKILFSSSTLWPVANTEDSIDFAPSDDPVEIPESHSPLVMVIFGLGLLGIAWIKSIFH